MIWQFKKVVGLCKNNNNTSLKTDTQHSGNKCAYIKFYSGASTALYA